MSTPVLAIVGLSGSGKTTMLERLIRELKWRGLRVGTLKHSSHKHTMDMPGKDSWRHKEAGAERTLFVGPETLQFVADLAPEETMETLADSYMSGLDIVLVEGFKKEKGDKIEVVRSERSSSPVMSKEDGLIAVISDLTAEELGLDTDKDSASTAEVKLIDINDIEEVADLVMSHFSLKV